MKKSFLFTITFLSLMFLSCGNNKQQVKGSGFQSTKNKEITSNIQESQFVCWVTSEQGISVKDIPSLSGNQIGVLNYKEEIEVYEIGDKELIDEKLAFWLKIKVGNQFGWIFGGNVTIIPENPIVETENLSLNEQNLIGIWTQGTDSSNITDFRFVENFEKNGRYTSGMMYSSMGTIGTYKIDEANREIIISESAMDDEYKEPTVHEYNLKVKKLTCDELIYEYDETQNYVTETVVKTYYRIPQRFLDLEKASTVEWLKYINKYGNEELFTGSTVFMYSVLMNQNDVALFLINSDIDINHKNKSGQKAADFLRRNQESFISQILKGKESVQKEKNSNNIPNLLQLTE